MYYVVLSQQQWLIISGPVFENSLPVDDFTAYQSTKISKRDNFNLKKEALQHISRHLSAPLQMIVVYKKNHTWKVTDLSLFICSKSHKLPIDLFFAQYLGIVKSPLLLNIESIGYWWEN